nr:apolipoprotein N-acyltransferase [Roseomonas acroporae]
MLSALALPPVHAVPVLLLSIPGLIVLAGAAPGWRRAAWLGFCWGWGHHLGGLYWITSAILIEADRFWWLVPIAVPAVAVPLALAMALPAAAARLAAPGWPRLLAFAAVWVAAEMLRGVVLTGFPWNLLGSVWAFAALPLQGASLVGVHGLSLLTVLLAGLPLLGRRAWAGGFALVLAAGVFGFLRLQAADPPPQPWRVIVVQGNVQQDTKWREDARWPIFNRYLNLTRAAVAQPLPPGAPAGTRTVVAWPETASPFLLGEDPVASRLAGETLPPGGVLLAGSVRVEWGPDRRPEHVFNSMIALDEAGRTLAAYDKSHLVPFGEYMPWRGLMPVRIVRGSMDFTPGRGPEAIAPGGLPPFGTLICYEVIFPGAVVPAPRPDWLLNITNDAWFGASAGPYQHLAAVRLRAVEEGLPIARAAQTGISALVDARGRVLAHLGLGESGSLAALLPGRGRATLFSRLGLYLPGGLALLCLLAAVAGTIVMSRNERP